jgi:ABC-type dipeptide/oligopeptide/nickel transport system ATPase component
MDFKDKVNRITNLHTFCYNIKDDRLDSEVIRDWKGTRVDAMLILTKNGTELNYMKTIEEALDSFDDLIPQLNEEELESGNNLRVVLDAWPSIVNAHEKLKFNITFFKQLNFFNDNIVAIGANGSGKTSLADSLRANLNYNGLVISAQRVLFIPDIETLPTLELAEAQWSDLNKKSRTFKNIDDFLGVKEEFGYVIKNLIVKHCSYALTFLESVRLVKSGSTGNIPNLTDLELVIQIWNELFDYRKLQLKDGVHLQVILSDDNTKSYAPIKLSEGEKAALYLIAQVAQAPHKGFIIIDEPEMYLHKTIISRLWDRLEVFRDDCIFIYLTHDLDFATNRVSAKKVWLKSFEYPTSWDIQEIVDTAIPERLIMELLGSRKNILFCEGEKGSIDEKIYKLIFPKATVVPVGSCLNVINFTKAYNRIPITNTKAYGLIDTDHHEPKRLEAIRKHHVYNIPLAEVENLFLVEDFLRKIAEYLHKDATSVRSIKTAVLEKLNQDKELQAAKFISSKVNDYFKDSHVDNGNSFTQVTTNFDQFKTKIDLETWYKERIDLIDGIVRKRDYNSAISIYNNKGLQGIAGQHLSIREFTDFCIKHIANDSSSQAVIKSVFPTDLTTFFN